MATSHLSNEISKFASNVLNGQLVTFTDQIRIDKIRSGSYVSKENNCDRFRLVIPYGGTTYLQWQVVFNSHEPHLPPDVIFGDNDQDFEPNLEEMTSLQYWNPDDANSLTAVIKELLEQYKKYQYELIKNFSQKVQFEFESIQELDTLTSMEVHVEKPVQGSLPKANFLIKLPIDLQRLPPYLLVPNQNPGEDFITLLVSYEGHDGSIVTPKIFLSPRVEQAFSDISGIKYPSWSDGDECLVSYIMAVHCYFDKKTDEIIESFERRRSYVAAFLSFYGTSVLEYDAESYFMMNFLMKHENFFFILTIEIGRNFPEEQPVFIMKSIYHCFSNDPYNAMDDSYPYSPRWSSNEMANRARSYLSTAIPIFKAASMKNRPYRPPAIALEM